MNRLIADVLAPYVKDEWGFIGTRAGMKFRQVEAVRAILTIGTPAIVRHGADMEFHAIWREVQPNTFADIWPASIDRAKLFDRQDFVHVQPVLPPLIRNEEIVKRSKFLLATPHSQREEVQAGTWQTIRKARLHKIPVLIIWPNGVLTLDHLKYLTRVEIPRA